MRRYTGKKQNYTHFDISRRKVVSFKPYYPVGGFGALTAAQELKMQIIAAEQANTK